MFRQISRSEIYALVWRSDCFEFDPAEEIPLDYHYYDRDRNCNVYFPSYYPNGDYHFFIAKDWSYGLFGHPWRKDIFVIGESLIDKIDEKAKELGLEKIKSGLSIE